jgi:hypothetical protein
LSTHLSLGLPSGLFSSGFPTKVCYLSVVCVTCLLCPCCTSATGLKPDCSQINNNNKIIMSYMHSSCIPCVYMTQYFDMTPERQNSGARKIAVTRLRHSKHHVSVTTVMRVAMKIPLGIIIVA